MKVALITGGAQRIGAHLAKELAKQGYKIALHYHGSKDEAQSVKETIETAGGSAELFACDFMQEEEVLSLVPRIFDTMGRLDVLVNNASTFEYDSVQTATRKSWDFHMEVNLRAPFVLSQAFAEHLKDDQTGNIINLIDQRVYNLTPHFATYTLSKAGLWTLTQTMAMAMAPKIRVNAIGPGPTLPSSRQSQESFEKQFVKVPLKKPTDLMDISNALVYMLGADSMTGQMIALDGGEHLGWAQGDNHTPPQE